MTKNVAGGKGLCFSHATGVGTSEGMAANSGPNNPELGGQRLPPEKGDGNGRQENVDTPVGQTIPEREAFPER